MRLFIGLVFIAYITGCGSESKVSITGDTIQIEYTGGQCNAILAGGWYCVGHNQSFLIQSFGDHSLTIVCQGDATDEDREYLHGVLTNDRC